MRAYGPLVLTSICLALQAGSPSVQTSRFDSGREQSPSEWSLFYAPTPPVSLRRVVPEFEPVDAVAIALPQVDEIDARKAQFYSQLVTIASRYVNVFVLVNDQSRTTALLGESIRRRLNLASDVMSRVTLLRAEIDTEWIRDYGPLFALDVDGEPVLLDNMYRDMGREADTERALVAQGFVKRLDETGGQTNPFGDYGHFWRRRDDAAPRYVNEILYLRRRKFARLIRPPLLLSGGDVMFTSDGMLLTSTQTLQINGGDEIRFRGLAKTYFAADRISYLRPLPGGMWHIDMFLKAAPNGAVMIGAFGKTPPPTPLSRSIQREAAEVLSWNRLFLKAELPETTIVEIPMPDASFYGRSSGPVYYRSYLNSLVLLTSSGRSAVIVPRFAGQEALEGAVAAGYRRAFPGADLHFIESDVLVEDFAGIHCVSIGIPAHPGRDLLPSAWQ